MTFYFFHLGYPDIWAYLVEEGYFDLIGKEAEDNSWSFSSLAHTHKKRKLKEKGKSFLKAKLTKLHVLDVIQMVQDSMQSMAEVKTNFLRLHKKVCQLTNRDWVFWGDKRFHFYKEMEMRCLDHIKKRQELQAFFKRLPSLLKKIPKEESLRGLLQQVIELYKAKEKHHEFDTIPLNNIAIRVGQPGSNKTCWVLCPLANSMVPDKQKE